MRQRLLESLGFAAIIILAAASPGMAQDMTLTFDGSNAVTSSTLQLIALITVLGLAPGILVTLTCFPFIVTVLAILRQAIGLQQSPPNMLLVSLSLFLTYYVMEPVFADAWRLGLEPASNQEITWEAGLQRAAEPFRIFMAQRVDEDTLTAMAKLREESVSFATPSGAPLSLLMPSFMLSELARAFQIGFLIFLPFLIIDLLVAAILMSMGMMMVPPVIVSLPFKLIFFVVSDGWVLISTSLVRGYL